MVKKLFPLVAIAALLFGTGCREDEVSTNTLDGTWVESRDQADTLVFEGENSFILNRGREERNGHLLPKYGAGLYFYELRTDTISVRNSVSSSSIYREVFIKIESDRLMIGDFYQKDTINPELLTFDKL
ncbi:hypothetical protein [Tunicatimonas pelagia]|uniref:hypothetical protein n=1 Tax=Tunicatimonas pelagia TaxID=931531 RepID=UPI002665E050|nr:hypothetical protein [Tunicatimonas pelagia]WKN42451.1 hypothetical protein P0M28_25790 [Tunicatimonas pelagia]